jgi:hypothetical protein
MAEVFQFVPIASLNARGNLAAFVEGCRAQLTAFGSNLAFDDDVWDITDVAEVRASSKLKRVTFSTAKTAKLKAPLPMAEPFRSFAKAYVRYQQGLRPTRFPDSRVAALRMLEEALRETCGNADVTLATADTFNRAAQIARSSFTTNIAHTAGTNLERVARFLDNHHLVRALLAWRNPLKREGHYNRIGKEFDERRAARLPSASALDAVAKAFNVARTPAEVLLACAAAILCSCPARISELLTLPVDCEAGPAPGTKGDAFGLRWWPAKNAEPHIKWIVPSMMEVVRRALANIRRHTDHARRVARWYEKNPTRLYLGEAARHLRSKPLLTMEEVSAILGTATSYGFCRAHGVLTHRNGPRVYVRFAELEKAILALLPRGFPVLDRTTGLTYSEGLFVVQHNQFRHNQAAPLACMIDRVEREQINTGLGARANIGVASLFSRLGLTEEDGSPIVLTSHKFRHYLNTLAQQGGLSQLDVAKWSGRASIRQNAAYDHESADEILEKVRATIGDEERWHGPLAELPRRSPLSHEEYARLAAPTAHTTEMGFCIHDFVMAPCQLHLDCIRCTEHVCIKGDRRKTENVRRQLAEARELRMKAGQALAEQDFGADRWVAHHTETVARLEALVAILDDPGVAEGSIIQLGSASMPSAIRGAAEERGILIAPPTLRATALLPTRSS